MSLRVRGALGAGLAAAALASAPALQAQSTYSLELLNGGKPVPNAQVLFLVDEGKVPLGTTNADGILRVDMSLVDVGKGQEVVAYEIECDGEIVIVFVLPQEIERFEEECELRRRENPECECRRIGAFLWGDDVVIDIGNRTVTPRTTGGTPPGHRITVGGGIDLRHMSNLEDVVGMTPGVIDHSATTWAPGFQFFTEYLLLGFVALGIEAAWSRMETEARFEQGMQTGELDYYEVGGTARIRLPGDGPIWPYLLFGLYRTWNKADFQLDGVSDQRTHVTRRDGLGAGLDWMFRPAWGVRAEGMYSTTFEDDDADEHIRLKLGLIFRPFLPETL